MILSNSRIKMFKSCRRKYELHYVEGLSPAHPAEALETGKNYHQLLEAIYTGHEDEVIHGAEFTKERAMAMAYYKFIFPQFKVVEAEKWMEYVIEGSDKIVGVVDAIAEDGRIVEHKTCGHPITEQYEYSLQWDEQLLTYMLMTGQRKAWYTVCRKPTIRQKQGESDEEFFARMLEWYEDDTDSKIRLLEVQRTDEEVEKFRCELISMCSTMKKAEAAKEFYKNQCACELYGRRCEYSSVCLHSDPNQQYIDFVKM